MAGTNLRANVYRQLKNFLSSMGLLLIKCRHIHNKNPEHIIILDIKTNVIHLMYDLGESYDTQK